MKLKYALVGALVLLFSIKIQADVVVEMLCAELNLPIDANDTQIIEKLDDPNSIIAMSLIKRKQIISAVPKLMQIVQDRKRLNLERIRAADALWFFDNNEWIPTIQTMIQNLDPNDNLTPTYQLRASGVLAKSGDFSQYDYVVKHVYTEKAWLRSDAIEALSEFGHPSNPVTDRAADVLYKIAISDADDNIRRQAIEGLDNLQQKKPLLKSILLLALKTNEASNNEYIRQFCKDKYLILDARNKNPEGFRKPVFNNQK